MGRTGRGEHRDREGLGLGLGTRLVEAWGAEMGKPQG